jgi:capsular polysaccharide export protein
LARPGRGVKPNHGADEVPTSRTRAIFMDSPGPIAEIAGSTCSHGIAAIGMLRAGDNAPPMRIFQQVNRPIASRTGAPGNRPGGRLRVGGMQLAPEAGAALFPDFAVEPRSADAAVPLARLGEGLLRAPPHAGMAAGLSVVALSVSGPPSPADRLDPARLLAERGWETPELIGRAQAARRALLAARIGGAWWGDELPAGDGDALVVLAEPMVSGNAGATSEAVLVAMLDAALGKYPAERVVVLAPRRAQPRLGAALAAAAARGARILSSVIAPLPAVERATEVYSSGGEIGLLALLAGRPVRAFRASFYTGWGLTADAPGIPQHDFSRTLDEVFAAHSLVVARYRDPFRNVPASLEETLALLAEWRRIDIANRRVAVCAGMSFWKRQRVADFLRSTAGTPVFRRSAAGAVAAARRASATEPRAIAVWASRMPPGLPELGAHEGVPLIRVEDGFVRSVGLGADFLPPASLVFDTGGMYYDPRSPSDLDRLLAEAQFDAALIERARRLIVQLVGRGVTKYNLGGAAPVWDIPPGARRILVPGQVEDDLSVLYGGGEIRTNLDLLACVRDANPAAFILYKPHPDVAAGHRKGAVPEALARRFANDIVQKVSTVALLAGIDEVHTMTSLAGFEALLRGRQVTVYGRPFYAGWGLTADRMAMDRSRRLTLEELVAGAMILYPRYLDPVTRLPCGPEIIIERLDQPDAWRAGPLVVARRLQGRLARRWSDIRAAAPPAGLAGQRPRR